MGINVNDMDLNRLLNYRFNGGKVPILPKNYKGKVVAEVEDGELGLKRTINPTTGEEMDLVVKFSGDKHGQNTDKDSYEGIPITEENGITRVLGKTKSNNKIGGYSGIVNKILGIKTDRNTKFAEIPERAISGFNTEKILDKLKNGNHYEKETAKLNFEKMNQESLKAFELAYLLQESKKSGEDVTGSLNMIQEDPSLDNIKKQSGGEVNRFGLPIYQGGTGGKKNTKELIDDFDKYISSLNLDGSASEIVRGRRSILTSLAKYNPNNPNLVAAQIEAIKKELKLPASPSQQTTSNIPNRVGVNKDNLSIQQVKKDWNNTEAQKSIAAPVYQNTTQPPATVSKPNIDQQIVNNIKSAPGTKPTPQVQSTANKWESPLSLAYKENPNGKVRDSTNGPLTESQEAKAMLKFNEDIMAGNVLGYNNESNKAIAKTLNDKWRAQFKNGTLGKDDFSTFSQIFSDLNDNFGSAQKPFYKYSEEYYKKTQWDEKNAKTTAVHPQSTAPTNNQAYANQYGARYQPEDTAPTNNQVAPTSKDKAAVTKIPTKSAGTVPSRANNQLDLSKIDPSYNIRAARAINSNPELLRSWAEKHNQMKNLVFDDTTGQYVQSSTALPNNVNIDKLGRFDKSEILKLQANTPSAARQAVFEPKTGMGLNYLTYNKKDSPEIRDKSFLDGLFHWDHVDYDLNSDATWDPELQKQYGHLKFKNDNGVKFGLNRFEAKTIGNKTINVPVFAPLPRTNPPAPNTPAEPGEEKRTPENLDIPLIKPKGIPDSFFNTPPKSEEIPPAPPKTYSNEISNKYMMDAKRLNSLGAIANLLDRNKYSYPVVPEQANMYFGKPINAPRMNQIQMSNGLATNNQAINNMNVSDAYKTMSLLNSGKNINSNLSQMTEYYNGINNNKLDRTNQLMAGRVDFRNKASEMLNKNFENMQAQESQDRQLKRKDLFDRMENNNRIETNFYQNLPLTLYANGLDTDITRSGNISYKAQNSRNFESDRTLIKAEKDYQTNLSALLESMGMGGNKKKEEATTTATKAKTRQSGGRINRYIR